MFGQIDVASPGETLGGASSAEKLGVQLVHQEPCRDLRRPAEEDCGARWKADQLAERIAESVRHQPAQQGLDISMDEGERATGPPPFLTSSDQIRTTGDLA